MAVFVRGDNNGLIAGLTEQQIYTAIVNAIEQGTIGDIDTGFVTTVKEKNKGAGLSFWLGTTAEYNALEEYEPDTLYIKTDDTTAQDIITACAQAVADVAELSAQIGQIDSKVDFITVDETTALDTVFDSCNLGVTMYQVIDVTNRTVYPETVPLPTSASVDKGSEGANVIVFKQGTSPRGQGFFIFLYYGKVYTAYVHSDWFTGETIVDTWRKIIPTDTGWQTLTIDETTGYSASTPAPQYRRIDGHTYIRGRVIVDMDTVPSATAVFATLPYNERPAQNLYRLIPGEGDRMARLFVSSSGEINVNYFKTYSGDPVTGQHWLQLDCDFLID